MSTPLQPLADYVVTVAEEAKTKTSSGIFIPNNAAEKPKTAKVVAVGNQVKQVKVGDRVVYRTFSTTEVKVEDADFIIVKEEDILAIVK